MSLISSAQKINKKINPSTIDDFKSMLSARGGLAKANRFLVIMQPPVQSLFHFDVQELIVKSISAGTSAINLRDFMTDPRDLTMLCESCSLPGRQIQTLDYASYRNTYKVPTGYFNEDVTFSFHVTNDYYIKKLFDKWMESVISHKDYHLGWDSRFSCDVIIHQLDDNNIPVYGVKLKGAFPISVNSIALDNSNEDTIKVQAVFTYRDFEEVGPITGVLEGALNVVSGLLTHLI